MSPTLLLRMTTLMMSLLQLLLVLRLPLLVLHARHRCRRFRAMTAAMAEAQHRRRHWRQLGHCYDECRATICFWSASACRSLKKKKKSIFCVECAIK
jgi:hypothetical protein